MAVSSFPAPSSSNLYLHFFVRHRYRDDEHDYSESCQYSEIKGYTIQFIAQQYSTNGVHTIGQWVERKDGM